MTFDIAGLKGSGKNALERAGRQPRQLVLLYALIAARAGILCSGLGWVLANQMDEATGLSGLGTRSILLTIQTLVSIVIAVASPLWDAGYMVSMLDVYRGKDAGPRRLLWGFARWKKLLVCGIFLLLQMFFLSYLAVIVAQMIYFVSPLGATLDLAVLQEAMAAGDVATLYRETLPFWILLIVAICAVVAYLVFRYQLVYYVMEDYPEIPGSRLLGASAVLIRGLKGQYFRLYLSFWWYYAAYLVLAVVPYLDVILNLTGVALPVKGDALAAGLYGIHAALLCGLQIAWKNRIYATLAAAYTQVRDERMSQT